MASNSTELTGEERAALVAIYDVFASKSNWPTYQHFVSVTARELKADPRELYFQLSEAALISPPVSREQAFQLRENAQVTLTVRGLAQLPAAAEDLQLLLACVRYLARVAQEFRPPDPTVAATLDVSSAEVAAELAIPAEDAALLRLGWLVQQTPGLWSSFSGPGPEGWGLTLALEQARRFTAVSTLEDYLRLAGGDAEPARAETSDVREATKRRPSTGANPSTSMQSEAPQDSGGQPEPQEQTLPDGQGPEEKQRLRFARSVAADLPSPEDLLGFDPLVKALHGLLNDANTVLPLAIAVTAPWGAGKSSVMLQLQAALHQEQAAAGTARTWATVRFDAWKFERGERLWAALAKAIYSQPQWGMSPLQRVSFRVRLELARRGWAGSILTLAWPCLVLAAIALAAVRVRVSGVGAVPAVIAAAAVSLAAITHYGNALANPFKRAIERHARAPDYEAHLGFTSEADRDIRVLTRLIAPDETHGLAVFVDDLDRCSSAHLVEVVEAMNQIFNSASDHRCVFVLGLDRDVVTSNINVAYASTVEQLRKDRNTLGERFGLEFLAKLVQLSVSIPEPTPQALQALMEKVTGNLAASTDPSQLPGEEEVARVRASIQSASGPTLASVADVGAKITQAPSAVVAAAVRQELAERIEDSPEVAAAEFAALPYLERNPRQLKRFHNAFRLQLYVANEDETVPFEFTGAELIALAKWVIVRLRWPDLGNAIAQDPALLLLLEAEANQEPSSVSLDLVDASRIEERDRWLARTGVRALMSEPDRSRRLSTLELKRYLRVA